MGYEHRGPTEQMSSVQRAYEIADGLAEDAYVEAVLRPLNIGLGFAAFHARRYADDLMRMQGELDDVDNGNDWDRNSLPLDERDRIGSIERIPRTVEDWDVCDESPADQDNSQPIKEEQ